MHSTPIKALKNALMELIQIDAAMGHWYTDSTIYRISLDNRTAILEKIMKKYTSKQRIQPQFFWLKSTDFSGFVVACLLQKKSQPYYVFGLGAEVNLLNAMYSAFLEASGVMQLAKINLLDQENTQHNQSEISANAIFNLDDNVALYAKADYFHCIQQRYLQSPSINASDLPPDMTGTEQQQVLQLISEFTNTQKDIYFFDMNGLEAQDLNLFVARVWSPQLLGLAIPAAAPLLHPRFSDYGKIIHEHPHPYP